MADYDREYDTDEVSLTSTVPSVHTGIYTVEQLLSERYGLWEDGVEETRYLVEWDNYPMYRCKKFPCTWEPPEHLDGTNFTQMWNQKRRQMGELAYEEYTRRNEEIYYKAVDSFEAAKRSREAKRHKKRTNLRLLEEQKKQGKQKRRGTPLSVVDAGGTKKDTSPRVQNWVGEQRALSPRTSLATREAIDSSQLNHLFVDSQDHPSSGSTPSLGQPEGDLFVRQPLALRQPPLQQSESSSEDKAENSADASDDSLMGDLKAKAKKAKMAKTETKASLQQRRAMQKPNQSPKSPAEPVASTRKRNEQRRPSQPSALSATSDQAEKAAVPKSTDLTEKIQRPTNSAIKTASSRQSKAHSVTEAQATETASSADLGHSAAQSTIRKTAPGTKAAGGIRFVNEPKTPKRAQWQHGDKLYNKLKFRGLANKRSYAEGTPDPGALDIVNAPAGLVKPSPLPPSENPYGRRESGTRRLQDDDPDDTQRRGSVDDIGPLKTWEVEKIPLVCPHWRLSSNCLHGAQKCHFMHRNKDDLGRDYPVGDINGFIPHKYRKPPLTCPYWLTSKTGCKKLVEACNYAHRNTGWIPLSEIRRDEPFAIDPNAIPETEKNLRRELEYARRKERMRPSGLTCWFWANSQCHKGADRCAFQHYNTGVVADPPLGHIGDKEPRSATEHQFGPIPLVNAGPDVAEHPLQIPIEQLSLPPVEQPPPAKMTCLQMKAKIEQACKLDFTDMFTSNDGNKALVDRRAFLVYHPEEHSKELDLITRWLLMHHVEVGNAWYDGSWDSFRQQILGGGSGVIIAHPDFEYFTELPGLGKVLQKQVRVWSVGLQEGIEYDATLSDIQPELRHDRIEIFPLGGFIYITDDVFDKKPQVALEIVKSFFAKIEKLRQVAGPISSWHEVDDAALFWRLCVRPELMEYLLHHCEEHAKELEAGDTDMQSRAELYTIFCETNYIEQDDPVTPLSLIPDKYPILSERRVIAETEPVDYFNTFTRSQEDANLHMIRYYAGLQVDMRRDYRHFFIVHTEPEAKCVQQWQQEIQTIAKVITPERCVEELGKEGGEGLFDFYERYMPEHEVKDGKRLQSATEGADKTAV